MSKGPIIGVNLGGWLVLEKWITPSLFMGTQAQDEFTFCQEANAEQLQRLELFRDSFITQADFEWLASHGVQAVRLPVGYWMFDDAAPFQPTVKYVDRAFEWAKMTGLKVLLDLHGAPGSQNGNDHSGRIGPIDWATSPANITTTLEVIQKLAKRYGHHKQLLGISLLNEPSPQLPKSTLLSYYHQAYVIIREACGEDAWVVYNDGYAPSRWRRELPRSKFQNVYIDMHHYQVFSPLDKRLPPWLNLLRTRFQLPYAISCHRRYHPVIIGEWSLTLSGIKPEKNSPAKRLRIQRTYGRLQTKAYQKTAASFFWTYRTESGGGWSFRDCLEKQLL